MTGINPCWPCPPADVRLSCTDIHIWSALLDQPAAHRHRLAPTLSPDERLRAARYHFERDRNRFIIRRGLLRTILGYYLEMDPERLRFSYGVFGKPVLMRSRARNDIRFNLSHSNGLVLYALIRDGEIGVDVEFSRPMPDADQVSERFFSPRENAVFRGLSTSQKQGAFFNCWTRKEAFIKASGEGLSRPLDQFDVSLVPGEPARLLSIEEDVQKASKWFVKELQPCRGYVAALAVEGHGWNLSCWHFDSERLLETSCASLSND